MIDWVIDASVAIKWVLDENYSEDARRLLHKNYALSVPDFFFAEIGNVLWKRVRRNEMSQADAQADYLAISAYPWIIFQSKDLITAALPLATQTKQAVYDAIYIRLAIEHNCQMVTADNKLIQAIASLEKVRPHILWVENIPKTN